MSQIDIMPFITFQKREKLIERRDNPEPVQLFEWLFGDISVQQQHIEVYNNTGGYLLYNVKLNNNTSNCCAADLE